jgi:NAD(P)-dependent dehydrogenase (short-subunit alcohol dehydrogenase family)
MTAPAGKTALIIGASRGLGYALAAEYLARGWRVTATVRGARQTGLHRRRRVHGHLRPPDGDQRAEPDARGGGTAGSRRPNGTIAAMSSGQGSVANNDKGGFEVYRASKSALNQLMRSFAARHAGDRARCCSWRPAGCRPTWAAPPHP